MPVRKFQSEEAAEHRKAWEKRQVLQGLGASTKAE